MSRPTQILHLTRPVTEYPQVPAGHPLNADVDFLALGRYEDGEPVDPSIRFDLFIKAPFPLDVVWTGAKPYVSNRLRDVLTAVAGDWIAFRPLTVNGEPYWVLQVTREIDALHTDTEFRRAPDGEILSIEQPVWDGDRIDGPAIFSIPQILRRLYCTQDVVDAYETSGCNGLGFYTSGRVV